MPAPMIRLQLLAGATRLDADDGWTATLAVGPQDLAATVLRHDPPTPAELERAIDLVEDALTGRRVAAVSGTRLMTADALLLALPGLQAGGTGLSRDAVEVLFQRLASRALGMPIAADELPHGREIAAALLIVRECMHHLGFDHLVAGLA